jgi:SAM-dependent methyltransferase
MMISTLKRKMRFFAKTPLHPQWLHRSNSDGYKLLISEIGEDQTVLDIGCYNKWAQQNLPPNCEYVGLDYYETATQWYESVPDVYGDALMLPFASESFDVVILIDVLEHISDTGLLFQQIHRVLKPGGRAVIALPFLYPIHDAPRDFVRLTAYGITELAARNNFDLELCEPIGSPIVTSAFLVNVALAKTAINWFSEKSVYSLLSIFFPPIILFTNLFAKLLSKLEIQDGFMANSYQAIFRKQFSSKTQR